MKPLAVLLTTFIVSLLIHRFTKGDYNYNLSGRLAMSVMLVFTSIAHFIFAEGMVMMLPEFIPYKTEVVYLTGVIEILAAIGLLIHNLRVLTAWFLIIFFVMILPANINAAIHNIDYQTASIDGSGLIYLWFRAPLQVLFIVWTYIYLS